MHLLTNIKKYFVQNSTEGTSIILSICYNSRKQRHFFLIRNSHAKTFINNNLKMCYLWWICLSWIKCNTLLNRVKYENWIIGQYYGNGVTHKYIDFTKLMNSILLGEHWQNKAFIDRETIIILIFWKSVTTLRFLYPVTKVKNRTNIRNWSNWIHQSITKIVMTIYHNV